MMLHERYKITPLWMEEGSPNGDDTNYVYARDANWITIILMEENYGAAGTAHNWTVYKATAAAGTGGTAMTTGVTVMGEQDISNAATNDVLAAITVTAGVFAGSTTTTTYSYYVIEIDPAALGSTYDWVGLYCSATDADTNVAAIAFVDQKYKAALGGPTAAA
jgi:hypothetical protein